MALAIWCLVLASTSWAYIKTLVSTNVLPVILLILLPGHSSVMTPVITITHGLSFVELIAGGMDSATQLKAMVKQNCGLAFGARVAFVFADQDFNLMSQQAADRSGTAGGEHLGFLNGLAVETKR
jgi:hypothetical protein